MATQQNTTTTAASMKPPSTRPRKPPNARMVQNFHLVWLDGGIDEENNEDCRNCITKLRRAVNTVNTFIDADECIDFITDTKEGKAFMMISGAFSQTIIPIVRDISQVNSIYIFCENQMWYEKWAQEGTKVKGIYTDITSVCEALNQTVREYDQNSVSISFVKSTDGASKENLDQLDSSFMYTQILKEILLTIDFKQEHINEFLTYCRGQFVGNSSELKNVDKIEKEYRSHQPIWWYTYKCFLYSMLNRALRMMEVDLIIKVGFFLRDLYQHITVLHSEQYGRQNDSDPFTVYRGQGLSQTDFNQLMKTQGGLLAFNNFLSTSKNRDVSLRFARRTITTSSLVGVLFVMKIDPSISATTFANIRNVSYYQREEEILFSMHSVFRIGLVKQTDKNDRLWQVDLTLTSDNDPQLYAVTESMREETRGLTGWNRLGQLLIKLGQFNKAEELYEILLKQTANEGKKAGLYHMLGVVKDGQGNYAEAARFYQNSLKINQKILSPNHFDLIATYNNIGEVCKNMGEYWKALLYYEKALEIFKRTFPANHPHLNTFYNNIGTVYTSMGDYSKALSYLEKAFEIRQKTLPANHPSLAISYNDIGFVHDSMGRYWKALSYYEKELKILQKTLPANHPSLAISYNSIGRVYDNMSEYSSALSYYEKALEIRQITLPANHPHLATSYSNIGGVYCNMGEHSKALSYNEKALEIRQKTLPANHPKLATSYNNIGGVYNSMGEYSKALSYHEKALEIRQITLSANHPDLTTSYNNIGAVYCNVGEYSKALSYYEKALEIYQRTLPTNHPHLALSYNYIGGVYNNMGECSKALSYYEKHIEILKKTFPANHPKLATSYNDIGRVYKNMGEYSNALSYYECALDIIQSSLPSNHPHLQNLIQNIEILKKNL